MSGRQPSPVRPHTSLVAQNTAFGTKTRRALHARLSGDSCPELRSPTLSVPRAVRDPDRAAPRSAVPAVPCEDIASLPTGQCERQERSEKVSRSGDHERREVQRLSVLRRRMRCGGRRPPGQYDFDAMRTSRPICMKTAESSCLSGPGRVLTAPHAC